MFVRAPKRLSPAQLAQAFGSMSDDDPRWIAMHQLLDEELATAMLDVSSPQCGNRDHAGGRVDALSTLKQRMLNARVVPLETPKPAGRKSR